MGYTSVLLYLYYCGNILANQGNVPLLDLKRIYFETEFRKKNYFLKYEQHEKYVEPS